MKTFRQILFWTHLSAGLIAGIAIAVMCFTGTILAFEKQIVAWSERDARRVDVPPNATRLPLADLQRRVREAQPETRPAGVTISADPADAVAFALGRDSAVYANPYTGEVRTPASTKVHDFMHTMEDWHRVLALTGDNRPIGKIINGVGNMAFCLLAITGLYLWLPRSWSWRGVRAIAVINVRASGKARDFNWHNSIGLWCAPILIVLTLTAVPMSFRWGNALVYRLVGEEPPPQPAAPGNVGAAPSTRTPGDTANIKIERPSPDARSLSQDVILARVQTDFPRWEQISFRTGGLQRGQRGAGTPNSSANDAARTGERNGAPTASSSSDTLRRDPAGENRGPQPFTVTVREAGSWPRTATTTLTLNPFSGDVLKREGHADFTPGRRLRMWTRFLHTGEALGPVGQLVAGLACLGGCFLAYTGFALSYRRFFGKSAV